jgi:hypothetical protein
VLLTRRDAIRLITVATRRPRRTGIALKKIISSNACLSTPVSSLSVKTVLKFANPTHRAGSTPSHWYSEYLNVCMTGQSTKTA